jgi:hypothetical protein
MSAWTPEALQTLNAGRLPRGTATVPVFPGCPPVVVRVAPADALLTQAMAEGKPLLRAVYQVEPPPASDAPAQPAAERLENERAYMREVDTLLALAIIEPPYVPLDSYAATGAPPEEALSIYSFSWDQRAELLKVVRGDTSALERFRTAAAREPLALSGEGLRDAAESPSLPESTAAAPPVAGRGAPPAGAAPGSARPRRSRGQTGAADLAAVG